MNDKKGASWVLREVAGTVLVLLSFSQVTMLGG